ncbi:MAG: hypothetical protein BWK78_07540 [Thiotrichaceae bacterium IS1]|nr:MAG: hypothetical protein BWK78_07540 [Thiotrichaceae bacterium IS1]
MYTLTIVNFPPTLHARLQDMARHNQCSVTQQILTVLEQYLTAPWPPAPNSVGNSSPQFRPSLAYDGEASPRGNHSY